MKIHIENTVYRERSVWLDVLRGLAIFGVVAVHSMQVTDQLVLKNKSELFSQFFGLGKYGVELFFFLSGWLLMSIYGIAGKPLGKTYWARRIGRIYPLWILFLAVAFIRWAYYEAAGRGSPLNVSDGQSSFVHSPLGVVILSLTFTLFLSASLWNNVIPGGWSIQSEMAHYLIFTLIRNRSLNSIINFSTLISFITYLAFIARPKMDTYPTLFLQLIDAWFRLGLYSTFGYFLFGILSFLVFSQYKEIGFTGFRSIETNFSKASFMMYLVIFLLLPCPFGNQIEAMSFMLIMILISFGILRNRIATNFFRFLGRYSYFIYFMHLIAVASAHWFSEKFEFIPNSTGSQQLVFVSIFLYSLAISSLLAIPSMKYFERPIIGLTHKIK
jgi:peptidoglycan/LPS O-acetylase OafA/YrhL